MHGSSDLKDESKAHLIGGWAPTFKGAENRAGREIYSEKQGPGTPLDDDTQILYYRFWEK